MNQNDFVQHIVQQVLSYIPGAQPFAGLIGPGVANFMSDPGSIANKFIWPGQNQTLRNSAMQYINEIRNAGYSAASDALSKDMELKAMMGLHRALNPNMDDAAIAELARQSMANDLSVGSLMYMATDPYKMGAALPMAQQLASTLHRRGSDFTLNGATYTKQVSDAIFSKTGIIHDVIDNPAAYGNLSAADVMSLGRELALTTQDGFRTSSGSFDASRFRAKLQDMAKSIEPWKDIFGKDIPQLLNQLESLTGTSLGTSSADIGALGHRMIGIMGATGARIQNIAAYKDALAGSLIDPTMSNRSILGSAALAGDLTLGLANLNMRGITSQELQGNAAKFYTGTARSKYAERFALAYAQWTANGGTSIEGFQGALRNAMASGMSHQEALLSVAGASSLDALDIYKGSDAYLSAIESGAGFSMTREVYMGQVANDVISRFTADNYASLKGISSSSIAKMFGSGMDTTRFLGMSASDKARHISNTLGVDGHRAMAIANDITVQAMMSAGADNTEEARAMFGAYYNESIQAKQASTITQFSSVVSELQRPGSIMGVLAALRDDPKADVSKLIKGYRGGIDIIEALLKSGWAGDTAGVSEDILRSGLNFAFNNYAELGEGGKYSDIGQMMMNSSDSEQKLKAYRIATGLNALGSSALANMTDDNMKAVRAKLDKAGAGDDYEAIARDAYIDSRLAAVNPDTNISSDAIKIIKRIADNTQITSKSAYWDEYKKVAGDTDEARSAFNAIWRNAKIGDIDGTDAMQKIADAMEKLPEFIEKGIAFFTGQGGK